MKKFVFKPENLSKEAKQILDSRIGYRDLAETDSGTYHYPKEIINFECNELGNTDIPDTLLKLYDLNLDHCLAGTCANPGLDTMDIQDISNFLDEQIDDFDLVWLTADLKQCKNMYGNGDDDRIEKWSFSPAARILVVADLGSEGVLIAYCPDDESEYDVHEFSADDKSVA